MLKWITILSVVLMFTACYKDDVVIEGLTYNMFDPDYIGPAFIEITSVGLEQPSVWNQVIHVTVDSDMFPNPTNYKLYVECLNDTSVNILPQQPAGSDDFTYIKSNVDLDSLYCYKFSLRIDYSNTRADEHCYTAQ